MTTKSQNYEDTNELKTGADTHEPECQTASQFSSTKISWANRRVETQLFS